MTAGVIVDLMKLVGEYIMLTAGGVISVHDYDFLYKASVASIHGPGTSVMKSAINMMEILLNEE